MSQAVVNHMVKQSNAAQDYIIRELISSLDLAKSWQAAEMLREFLQTKQNIEHALTVNPELASRRANVETLVDSIMHEVCNEILVFAELQGQLGSGLPSEDGVDLEDLEARIASCKERILRAHTTLQETEKQIECRRPPQAVPTDEGVDVLDNLICALREENELSESINQRIERELPSGI